MFVPGTEAEIREKIAYAGHHLVPPTRKFEHTVFYDHEVAICTACEAVLARDPVNGMFFGSATYDKCFIATTKRSKQ